MVEVLCFNCGHIFTVPYTIEHPTKQCPKCKDKTKNDLPMN